MRVGIPREVKDHEHRAAITPSRVRELVAHGHSVQVEKDAGTGSSITDEEHVAADRDVRVAASLAEVLV